MNTPTTERNRCKDSQGLNSLHVNARAVNSLYPEEENEIVNDKLQLRKDFRNKKKNKKIHVRKQKIIIRPHATSIYGDFVTRLSSLDIDFATEALESIVVAFIASTRKSNLQKALIVLAKLLKTHLGVTYSNVISKILLSSDMKFIKNILPWSLEDLESYMKELLNNWKLAYKNEAFSSIVSLVSTFLAIFYSADKKWSISLGSFSMFLFDAKNSCKGATSLVDALLKVSTFVIGGLKKYMINGSYSGFLYSDDQLGELDAIVSTLQAQFKYVKPGNLGKFTGLDENTFDQELQRAISSGEKLILLYDGPTKKFVMDKIRMLRQLHCDFIQTRASGGLRIAPFAYLLAGSTGLGKSSVNEILMRYILSSNGFNHQDQYIVTLNSQDKFFSTYRSYVNGVIFDDFSNVRSDFVEESPCDTLLKFVNNIPFYLNMAELELKGSVVAEPKVVGITTNVSDIDSSVYSNQASSIMRRLKVHIYARVKPEFQKEGSVEIDSSKVQAKFGNNILAPDIWLFDVYVVRVVPIPRPPKLNVGDVFNHRDDKWHLEYVQWNGHDMKDATINELLMYIKEATAVHYKEQNDLIERSKLFNGDIFCKECGGGFEYCVCTNVGEASASVHKLQDIVEEVNPISERFVMDKGSKFLSPWDICEDSNVPPILQETVLPHSDSGETFYPLLYDERQKSIEKGLKDMLFSWIIEGRCNFDTICSDFIASCSKELQYLLIVSRKVAEKWFRANKRSLIEICFPVELEGTVLGDYYSIVVRKDEVKLIATISFSLESAIRILLFYFTYQLHIRWGPLDEVKYIMPLIGNYLLSKMDFPTFVTKIYAEWKTKIFAFRDIISTHNYFERNVYILVFLLIWFSTDYSHWFSTSLQTFALLYIVFFPLLGSFKHMSMYSAPRALSLLYRKEKEECLNDWSKLAPATLTLSALYCSKNDIVDFYVEACEKWYLQPQSRLKPTSAEVEKRDAKHKFDDEWFKNCAEPFLDPLPTSALRTPAEVRNAVGDNVWSICNLTNNSKSNCFVVCSGCVLIPYHYIPRVSCIFRFTRHNRGNKGNKSFDALIEPEQCIRVKNYDLAMVWVPKTRDVRDLIDCFPLEFHETSDKRSGRVASRDFNGDLEWSDVRELSFTSRATSGMGYTFPGIFYIWNGAKEGKCLSPVISDDRNASISGLHIGGSIRCRDDGGYIAYGVTPTRQDLLDTKALLERFSTVIPMSSSGIFATECMGIEVLHREIKKKSCYLRMEENNSAYFLGSSLNCNRTPKSQVRDTPIKLSVKKLFDIQDNWGPPKFKGPDGHSPHEPWEIGMKKWIVDKPGLPFGLLNKAKIEYTNNLTHILFSKGDFWKSEIRTLTWDETVNGIPGKRFIDSMNFKSSIGFPFKGSKKLFSTHLGKIDGWQDKRVLDPQFIEEAEKIEALYKEGKRYYPWFTSTLKDEPTLETKDKVRVFQATSTPFQLVMRKYTLGICRFLQMNPLDSECAVGIDPCSSEWNEMYNHLKQSQTPFYDRWFAIDYKAYDTSIPSQMIMAIGRIFVDIAKIAGYTKEEIIVLNSIFSELSFSIVDFNGDVLMLDGANPSGNSLTVFINSLCNSLLMRIYFYHLYPRRKFTNNVRMMSYGDDLIAAVGSLAGNYTMKGYAKYLAQFGFVVTPAQKDEDLKSFSKLREIDFLKRKFVWSADYGAMIAPLDENSIYKRLCNYMTSETSVEVIVGANIDGALDEWAFYGKAVYLDRQKKLIKIVEEFELHRFVHRLYMTYEQRVFMWRQNNADPAVMGKGQSMDTDQSNCDSDWLGFFGWGNIISKMGIGGPPLSHDSGSISSDDQMSINERTNNTTNNKISFVDTKNLQVAGELIPQEMEIVPHSFAVVKEEIMQINDGSSNQVVDIPYAFDDTRMASDATDNSLESFLGRPLRIHSFDWTPGTPVNFQIDPWKLYLENKRVSNKVCNYKLFRGTMKIKVMINGNSFFYGRLMMSYWPLEFFDTMTVDGANDIDLVQFSQMPRLFLDPTTSQGGEMSLPFFWHNDYVDLISLDYQKLGVLVFHELNNLKHTSGDISVNMRASVSVYAWMENVQLSAPTAINPPFIVPQSTPAEGEQITSYQMGFDPSRHVNPVSQFLEPRACSTTICVDQPDTTNKMTIKSDQGLSIDPRILGLGPREEMGIADIASRESYTTKFNWTIAAASDSLLFNIRVTPALSGYDSGRIQFTAACGAVLPFKYWNGTFKMRLQVVASAFHRGRLAVVYDPNGTSVPREDNVAYTQIIDISTCRDVTFSVGPNQDRTLLEYVLPGFGGGLPSALFGTSQLSGIFTGNGTIAVYVLNELTIPNATAGVNNDVQVNVFTSMDKDFQVFVPSGNHNRYSIVPQSTGVDVTNSEAVIIEESSPYDEQLLSLDQPTSASSMRHKVYAGENIESFREMLKRYYMWTGIRTAPVGTSLQAIEFQHMIFPGYKGSVLGAVHRITGDVPYNFFQSTLLNYLTPAFQAWRGSIRYKLFPRCKSNVARGNGMNYVSERFGAVYSLTQATYDVSTLNKAAHGAVSSGTFQARAKGGIALAQTTNPVVQYEIPWYENYRFCPGKISNWTTSPVSSRDVPDKGALVVLDSANTAAGFYDVHVAAGDDFSLNFFTGWPPMYYTEGYPAPFG
nr:MAG: polyprotein [Picornavirales sp.]